MPVDKLLTRILRFQGRRKGLALKVVVIDFLCVLILASLFGCYTWWFGSSLIFSPDSVFPKVLVQLLCVNGLAQKIISFFLFLGDLLHAQHLRKHWKKDYTASSLPIAPKLFEFKNVCLFSYLFVCYALPQYSPLWPYFVLMLC